MRGSAGRFNGKGLVYLVYFVCLVYSAGQAYHVNLTREGCDRQRSFVSWRVPRPRSIRDKDAGCKAVTQSFRGHLILQKGCLSSEGSRRFSPFLGAGVLDRFRFPIDLERQNVLWKGEICFSQGFVSLRATRETAGISKGK